MFPWLAFFSSEMAANLALGFINAALGAKLSGGPPSRFAAEFTNFAPLASGTRALCLEGFAGAAGGTLKSSRRLAIRLFAINVGVGPVDVALGAMLPSGPDLSCRAPPPLPSRSLKGRLLLLIPHGGGRGNFEKASSGAQFTPWVGKFLFLAPT